MGIAITVVSILRLYVERPIQKQITTHRKHHS